MLHLHAPTCAVYYPHGPPDTCSFEPPQWCHPQLPPPPDGVPNCAFRGPKSTIISLVLHALRSSPLHLLQCVKLEMTLEVVSRETVAQSGGKWRKLTDCIAHHVCAVLAVVCMEVTHRSNQRPRPRPPMGIKDVHRDDTSGCDETGQEVSVCRRSVWAVTVVCATRVSCLLHT